MMAQATVPRRVWIAGLLVVVAGVQYLALEAVTAAAWSHPPYSYALNFISDLGNPIPGDVFAGRTIDSPLAWVMNTAFILQGVLFIAATLVLRSAMPARVSRPLLILAFLHGLGVICVGLFHASSVAVANGQVIGHGVGATLTIVIGNVIAIVVAASGSRLGASRGYRIFSYLTGILGIVAFALILLYPPLTAAAVGIPERIAVYTIIVWEVVTGLVVVRASLTSRTR